ncbi:type II CRISPR-associated endonuclease Cas1 [Acidaminococcus massiliensis]|uniref:type II CRISPR-associated endonuclease Cas1 n=1 Tax=Acidaminococcus massiliensis TaxID=1852375 RepID=UPI0022E8D567|nr:type II CRISPR-associated endonuclease Cas1 [Acidaminococcus massiliensis]
MGYRNIVIASGATLSCREDQLIILNENNNKVPIEDISAIVLENQQSRISLAALEQLVSSNVTVYLCDKQHIPSAVVLPFYQNSTNAVVIEKQEQLSVPQTKQVWKQIVVAKIQNQGRCLKERGDEEGNHYLMELAKTVTSGDIHNVEATAARYYFRRAFGEKFTRTRDDGRNNGMNYGYAIMRGLIARLLTGYGFMVIKGIHHCNKYNSFNLADDFMEPLRPVVDLFVLNHMTGDDNLTPELKHALVNLLGVDVLSGGQIHSLNYGAERMIQSFMRICQQEGKELMIPELVQLRQHQYE